MSSTITSGVGRVYRLRAKSEEGFHDQETSPAEPVSGVAFRLADSMRRRTI